MDWKSGQVWFGRVTKIGLEGWSSLVWKGGQVWFGRVVKFGLEGWSADVRLYSPKIIAPESNFLSILLLLCSLAVFNYLII